jgi:hypothetical protein
VGSLCRIYQIINNEKIPRTIIVCGACVILNYISFRELFSSFWPSTRYLQDHSSCECTVMLQVRKLSDFTEIFS